MHIEDGFDVFGGEDGIPELPNGKWASLKEALDTVLTVLEDETGSLARVRHILEDGCLDLLVDDFALKFAVKHCFWRVGVAQLHIGFQRNTVAGVAQTTHLFNVNLLE